MQLLVSVRNVIEAERAADAGADIVDVKEPNSGPLGFAGVDTIREICGAVDGRIPVSAALGECSEWLETLDDPNCGANESNRIADITGLHFVKLGLADLSTRRAPNNASSNARDTTTENREVPWQQQWQSVRSHLQSDSVDCPDWVAVAYADHAAASAPSVWDVLDAAAGTGCTTLLIDTFSKDGSGTLNWLTIDELHEIRRRTFNLGLRFALAGQLTEQHLPIVRAIQPDIFAVRGAVCEDSDRTSVVSADRVRRLRAAMNSDSVLR